MASRSVCWRAGRSRAPPVSSGSRRSSRAQHRLRRQQPDARRRQLDRQRQAVQAGADLGDGRGVLVGQREVGSDRRAPARRTARRPAYCESASGRRSPAGVRAAPAAAPAYSCSPRRLQRLPAGHQHREAGTGRQQLGHDRRGGQDLLEVVEQQQDGPPPQVAPSGRPAIGRPPTSRTPSAWAMVDGTSAGSEIGASSTRNTPCSKSSSRSAATWRPRRVFPVPPGPVSVTSRTPSLEQQLAHRRPVRARARAGRSGGSGGCAGARRARPAAGSRRAGPGRRPGRRAPAPPGP